MIASSQPVKLKLTTMMGKDSIVQSARVSGFRVRGLSSKSWISLPPTYIGDFIPLDRSHIPTSKTAERWNQLKGIAQEIPSRWDFSLAMIVQEHQHHGKSLQEETMNHIPSKLTGAVVRNSSRGAKSTEVTGLCHSSQRTSTIDTSYRNQSP